MFILKRALRVKDEIELPDGSTISIDFDVETNLRQAVSGEADVIKANLEWKQDMQSDDARMAFFEKYRKLLMLIVGKENIKKLLEAYDGHIDEVCSQMDDWYMQRVRPVIVEASARRREQLQKLSRKYTGLIR